MSGKAETTIQMARNMIEYTGMLTYGKRRTMETTKTAEIELVKHSMCMVDHSRLSTTAAAD
jgi:hypothetical protein